MNPPKDKLMARLRGKLYAVIVSVLRQIARARLASDPDRSTRLQQAFAAAFPRLGEVELRDLTERHLVNMWFNGSAAYWARAIQSGLVRPRFFKSMRYVCTQSPFDTEGPIILLAPHYGNLLLGALYAIWRNAGRREFGFFLNHPDRNPSNAFYVRMLSRAESKPAILYNDRSGILRAVRILQRGGIVLILPDVFDLTPNITFVPFMGRMTMVMLGSASIALRTRATVFPVYCFFGPPGRWTAQIDEPIAATGWGDGEDAVYRLTTACFAAIERQLRTFPEPWVFWEELAQRQVGDLVVEPFDRTACLVAFEQFANEHKVFAELVAQLRELWPHQV